MLPLAGMYASLDGLALHGSAGSFSPGSTNATLSQQQQQQRYVPTRAFHTYLQGCRIQDSGTIHIYLYVPRADCDRLR